MSKYRVFGVLEIGISMVVEADDYESAIEKADEDFDGISNYAGNGRPCGALVGTDNSDVKLETLDVPPNWEDAEKVG